MIGPPNDSWKASNDLRLVSDKLGNTRRILHEQTRGLKSAVEEKNAASKSHIQLLNNTLHILSIVESELSGLHHAVQDVQQLVQVDSGSLTSPHTAFEHEREALQTSIVQLTQRHNEQETLYEIARTLNSKLEFDEVLRLVMDLVIAFVDAERGFLMLEDPKTRKLEFTIARDKEARTIDESAFNVSRGTIQRVISTREPLVSDDAQSDTSLKAQESIFTYGIRSIMCVPLIVRNKCIGAVYVDRRITAKLFFSKHRDLLMAFCNQAAIAIDNARLYTQVNDDKQYMDNIFSSMASGVITTDSCGTITEFNKGASSILCLKREESLGKHYEQVFAALPQLGLIELLRRAVKEHEHGTSVPLSCNCEIPGRGSVYLDFHVSSLRNAQGDPIGMTLVIDDRTELKRSKAELAQSQDQVKEIRRIFEHYVHPNVVDALIKDKKAFNLGGETKEISVVFADIRGYTSLSEKMASEDVMNLINRYLNIMCEAIWEEEGTLTAFQGDALMAIFNAPLEKDRHALRAVRAAWKMHLAVQAYQRSHPKEMPISFGFGVNTGSATIGNVGSQEHLQNYTAIGDAVNIAARLQENVTDNRILLSDSTYLRVYRYVRVGKSFPLRVKNKAEPLDVRYLLDVR